MLYLGYLIHAWLMFNSPLTYLDYRPSLKKQSIFTIFYALGIVLLRGLYKIFPLPFGVHIIPLIILNIILFKVIIKEISWMKSIFISLILMISMLINDALIVLPFMKYFNVNISDIEANGMLGFFCASIVSNFLLIIGYIVGILRLRKK